MSSCEKTITCTARLDMICQSQHEGRLTNLFLVALGGRKM